MAGVSLVNDLIFIKKFLYTALARSFAGKKRICSTVYNWLIVSK